MPTTPIIRLSILVCIHLTCLTGANAAELSYSLSSPLVGGNNSAPYQIELAREGQKKQIAAKAISDVKQLENEAKAAINNSPTARLANSLQSQLFTQIAMQMSNKILDPNIEDGSFEVGNTRIEHSRLDDGQLMLIVTDLLNNTKSTFTFSIP